MAIDKDKIAKILTEKGAIKPCHRCGKTNFTVLEGYSTFSLQQDLKGVVIGGPSVPICMVACTNCGSITPHALGALGLLPNAEQG